MILGDPGSGKSSLLQYIALVWAERPVSELPLHPIPLLIELRTYARDKQEKKCQDILSFIHSGNVTCRLNQQQLHERLQRGEAIALFDGIDEVFDPALRDEVVTDIHRFTNTYPNVQVIATSRWLGYKAQRLRDAEFRHFMLQELDEEQIEAFIQRWHELTFSEGADKIRKRDRLQKAIQDSKAIRELAGNPLLLTMMAILNRNQELPRDRPKLYERASEVLLHRWDVERNLIEHRLDPMTIDYQDKQAMLRKVAHHMQSSEKGLADNIISTTDLEGILTDHLKGIEIEQPRTVARLLITQLRTRNFILCYLGGESYGFVHRTFLEYFCAEEIVQRFEKQRTLSFEELRDEVFGQHWQDKSWHEVLRLICGMTDAKFTGELIKYLIWRAQDEIDWESTNINIDCDYGYLLLAADCLLEIQEPTKVSEVAEQLLIKIKEEIETEDKEDTLYLYKSPEALIKKVERLFKYDPDLIYWLREIAIEEKNSPAILIQAIHAIARNPVGSDTSAFLKDRVFNSTYEDVCFVATHELIKNPEFNQNIVDFIKELIRQNDSNYLRELGFQCLTYFWKDIPETYSFTIGLAKQDKDTELQLSALLTLISYSDDISNVVDILRQAVQADDYFDRMIVIETLLSYYHTHPETLEMLRDRATNDPDEQLREWAQQQLSTLEQNTQQ